MGKNIRMILAMSIYILGFAFAIYIGGWILLLKPIKNAIVSYTMGKLNIKQIIVTLMKCICSLTVTGFIWCLGYMASNRIYDSRDEK